MSEYSASWFRIQCGIIEVASLARYTFGPSACHPTQCIINATSAASINDQDSHRHVGQPLYAFSVQPTIMKLPSL